MTQYMAKLRTIPLPTETKKKSGKEVPSLTVPGDTITRFNEAREQMDAADQVCKELAPELKALGLEFVFQHNCANPLDPKAQINSVRLTDDEGSKVTFTWTRRDSKCDLAAVEGLFQTLRDKNDRPVNLNLYVAETPSASFDESAFMVNGKFSRERYDDFQKALQAVADKHGIANPLKVTKKFGPVKSFHETRFRDFTAEQNLELAEVLPTTTSLEPVKPDDEEV